MTHELKIVFPHIAKTGGTALLYHFRQNLGEDRIFVYGPHSRCTRFFADQRQLEELEPIEREKCSVVQGHGVTEMTLGLLNDSKFKLMIVLREPVALTRSRFNQRTIGMRRRGSSVEPDTFMQENASNVMTERLLRLFPTFVDPTADADIEKVKSILRKFDYVYTTEKLDIQAARMMTAYDLPPDIEKRRVTGGEKVELGVTDEEIMSLNEDDQTVFEAFNREVDSDGDNYNALGFDKNGRDTVISNIVSKAPTGTELKEFCYDELAYGLTLDLQAEMALRKIECDPDSVAIVDLSLFEKILLRKWNETRITLPELALERSDERARRWVQRFRQNARAGSAS